MQLSSDEMSRKIEVLLGGGDAQLIKAKSLAEISIAVSLLPGAQKYNSEIVTKKLSCAIELAGENVNDGELAMWKLCLAHKLYKLFKQQQDETDMEKIIRLYSISTELFCDIANSKSSPDEIKAQTLCRLGMFLHCRGTEHVTSNSLNHAITESKVLHGSLNPEDYFKAAYELSPASPTVCNNYTFFLIHQWRLDEAQDMINSLFAVVGEDHQFLEAYSTKGELLIKLYRKHRREKHIWNRQFKI